MDNELKKEIILDNYKYPFNKNGSDELAAMTACRNSCWK